MYYIFYYIFVDLYIVKSTEIHCIYCALSLILFYQIRRQNILKNTRKFKIIFLISSLVVHHPRKIIRKREKDIAIYFDKKNCLDLQIQFCQGHDQSAGSQLIIEVKTHVLLVGCFDWNVTAYEHCVLLAFYSLLNPSHVRVSSMELIFKI